MMPRPSAGKMVFIMAGIAVIAAMVPVFCILNKLAGVGANKKCACFIFSKLSWVGVEKICACCAGDNYSTTSPSSRHGNGAATW